VKKKKKNKLWISAIGLLAGAIFLLYVAGIGFSDDDNLPDSQLLSAQGAPAPKGLCTGYREDVANGSWGPTDEPCPANFAINGQDDPPGDHPGGPAYYIPIVAACCPLPTDDILTDDTIYNVLEACPDNYVATGGTSENCGASCGMRCTRINTDRYMLGAEHRGMYWSKKWSYAVWGRGTSRQIDWEDIPAAHRYSHGRRRSSMYDVDGCIGVPFGSLLVRKEKKSCDGFFYRQVLYKDGTPVLMYPKCDRLEHPEEQAPTCVNDSSPASSPPNTSAS
jgi:hypothetical protein